MTGHHRQVFPNARIPYRELPMSRGTLWSACRALDIPKERMTKHGFRAMARTILDEVLGFRSPLAMPLQSFVSVRISASQTCSPARDCTFWRRELVCG